MKNKLYIFFLFALLAGTAIAQPGANDPTFNPGDIGFGLGDGASGAIYSTALQSDGKIIIGGGFTYYNGTSIRRIARLNSDGTLDNTFNPGSGASSNVYSINLQPDGKIIITGTFTEYDGMAINRIARLNADGSLDNTFNPGTGPDIGIYSCSLQPDGKIIITGAFTSYNGANIYRIARINPDGTLDNTFNTGSGANNDVNFSILQPDGKIIIGGNFTSYNGTAINRIARLNSDGTLDNTFDPGTGANTSLRAITLQSDGKIIIGGDFTSYNGTSINQIARLNVNGSLDNTFDSGEGVDNFMRSIQVQSDGKMIITGDFTKYNETDINHIARLNVDGTIDSTFNPGEGASNSIHDCFIQSDGKIIIGGTFIYYDGVVKNRLARLYADGTLDNTFNPSSGVMGFAGTTIIQPNGKILIGGSFLSYNGTAIKNIARLNLDGSIDNTFNTGSSSNGNIESIVLQADGKIIVGGLFTTFNETNINRIVRLNMDGSLDSTFNPGAGANSAVSSIAIQPDGKIIIAGDFTSYSGTTINRIARINADGTLDNTFNPGTGADKIIQTVALQPDGKIIIGGEFTSFNGIGKNKITRLNSDGTLDNTFNIGSGANNRILQTALQSDGKIIIVGNFNLYNGIPGNRIARLNEDGSLDNTFDSQTGANNGIGAIAIQPDGKIIIGGDFTSYHWTNINRIARLNPDGTLDDTFDPGTGANEEINGIAIQSDGKIIITGRFTSYNNIGRNKIARLLVDYVGIETSQKQNIKLFPNPNDGQFVIELVEQSDITIINSLGEIVHTSSYATGSHSINLRGLASGMYLLKSESIRYSIIIKFFINRS